MRDRTPRADRTATRARAFHVIAAGGDDMRQARENSRRRIAAMRDALVPMLAAQIIPDRHDRHRHG